MADGNSSHEDGWLEALRHLSVAGPLTANGLASRLGLDERPVRQRLITMTGKKLLVAQSNAKGHKRYTPSQHGLDLLSEGIAEVRQSMDLVLVVEPVVPAVHRELWHQVSRCPPLWVLRTRGRFRWIAICRSSTEGDELADALNAAGDPNRVACLSVAVEGKAPIDELSRGY